MIDVTLTIAETDYSSKLSTYKVEYEYEWKNLVTTIDGTEYGKPKKRPLIVFSLVPLTESECAQLYDDLSTQTITVSYTDPNTGDTESGSFRMVTKLSDAFGLSSVDGNRYYKSAAITLRCRTVL